MPVALALSLVIGILSLTGNAAPADARPRPEHARFTANKSLGIGLMVGFPSGLSAKYFVGRDQAFDFGFGVIGGRDRGGVHVHFDYLWHPLTLVKTEPFDLPLYFGLGARLFDWNDGDRGDLDLGVRAPGGISFDFNHIPIDAFLEFALVLDLETDRGEPSADFNGAAGVRYYF